MYNGLQELSQYHEIKEGDYLIYQSPEGEFDLAIAEVMPRRIAKFNSIEDAKNSIHEKKKTTTFWTEKNGEISKI